MADLPQTLTYEQFSEWVADALANLYDFQVLRRNPLADLFAPKDSHAVRKGQNLRRLLLDSVYSMRPEHNTRVDSPDWRAYRILELRYVEGITANDAMGSVGLARSHFFHEQARALQAATQILWESYERMDHTSAQGTKSAPHQALVRAETERLRSRAAHEGLDAVRLLDELRNIVEPLVRMAGKSVSFRLEGGLVLHGVDRVVFRQAVLGIIMHAVAMIGATSVEIAVFANTRELGILVTVDIGNDGVALFISEQAAPELDVVRQLLNSMGGSLRIDTSTSARWEARLLWPDSAPSLLVIDDNEDMAALFQRYLADSGWQVVSALNGDEARRLVAEIRPSAICLDVLMPVEDGWEILRELKANEATHDIPVIICSVLDQPKLALSLGADAYLAKPVTQNDLISALSP